MLSSKQRLILLPVGTRITYMDTKISVTLEREMIVGEKKTFNSIPSGFENGRSDDMKLTFDNPSEIL